MKKQITKKLMVLAFAVIGIVMVGNNVFSMDTIIVDPGNDDAWKEKCDPVWEDYRCKVGSKTYSFMKPKPE